jgi:hypothetical protein
MWSNLFLNYYIPTKNYIIFIYDVFLHCCELYYAFSIFLQRYDELFLLYTHPKIIYYTIFEFKLKKIFNFFYNYFLKKIKKKKKKIKNGKNKTNRQKNNEIPQIWSQC